MNVYDYSVIAVLVGAIAYGCYTDLTSGKIPNKLSLGLVLFGLLYKGTYVALGSIQLFNFLWLALGSLFIVFTMFYIGIWAPGDSKLFWGISITIPSKILVNSSFDYTPVILLFNIFVPYFLYMMILIFIQTSLAQKKTVVGNLLKSQLLAYQIAIIIIIIGFSTAIRKYSPIELSSFTIFALLLASFIVLQKFVQPNKILYLLAPFSVFSLIWAINDLTGFLLSVAIVAFVFLFIRFLINLSNYLFIEEVKISDLQQGSIPGTLIIKDSRGDYRMKDVFENGLFTTIPKTENVELIVSVQPEGISQDQIDKLQELAAKGIFRKFNDKIKIQKKQIFAPVILTGTLITLLARGMFTDFAWAQIQKLLS